MADQLNKTGPQHRSSNRRASGVRHGDWISYLDDYTGVPYFHNLRTGETIWEAPPEWPDDDTDLVQIEPVLVSDNNGEFTFVSPPVSPRNLPGARLQDASNSQSQLSLPGGMFISNIIVEDYFSTEVPQIEIQKQRDRVREQLAQAGDDETSSLSPEDKEKLKRAVRRRRIGQEIVETERTYVQALSVLEDEFMVPLQKRDILSANEITYVFNNIRIIASLNRKLLADLEQRLREWRAGSQRELGDIFVNFAPFFKLYKSYINNHAKAVAFVTELQSTNRNFARFLDQASKNPRCAGNDLKSFLIMPIQRVPRYKLLLQQILATMDKPLHKGSESSLGTNEQTASYYDVKIALEEVSTIAQEINEAMRIQEQSETVLSIQQKFFGQAMFVAPGRCFLLQGGPIPVKAQLSQAPAADETKGKFISATLFLFNDVLVVATEFRGKYKIFRQMDINEHFYVEDVKGVAETLASLKEDFEAAESDPTPSAKSALVFDGTSTQEYKPADLVVVDEKDLSEDEQAEAEKPANPSSLSRFKLLDSIFSSKDRSASEAVPSGSSRPDKRRPHRHTRGASLVLQADVDRTKHFLIRLKQDGTELELFFTKLEDKTTWLKELQILAQQAGDASFFKAASTGNSSAVVELLDTHSMISTSARDKNGWTALMYTAQSGTIETVMALVGKGADINLLNHRGQSALHIAIMYGKWTVAHCLVRHYGDVWLKDEDGWSPVSLLKTAFDKNAPKKTRSKKKTMNAKFSSKALQEILSSQQSGNTLSRDEEAFLELCQMTVTVALFQAAREGNLKCIETVEALSQSSKRGCQSSHAVEVDVSAHETKTFYLVKKRHFLDPDFQTGYTALMMAAARGHALMVDKLLVLGGERAHHLLLQTSQEGETAYEVAWRALELSEGQAGSGCRGAWAILWHNLGKLIATAPVEEVSTSTDGRCSIQSLLERLSALYVRAPQQMRMHLDFDVPDVNGWTWLMHMAHRGTTDWMKPLFQEYADGNKGTGCVELQVDHSNKNGETPLMMATELGHVDAVLLLLENRASPMVKDRIRGVSVLELAQSKYQEVSTARQQSILTAVETRAEQLRPKLSFGGFLKRKKTVSKAVKSRANTEAEPVPAEEPPRVAEPNDAEVNAPPKPVAADRDTQQEPESKEDEQGDKNKKQKKKKKKSKKKKGDGKDKDCLVM